MAGNQVRSSGLRYIFASLGLASRRRRPLISNVKPCKSATARTAAFSVVLFPPSQRSGF